MDRTTLQGRTGDYGATDYETDYDLYDYIEEDELKYRQNKTNWTLVVAGSLFSLAGAYVVYQGLTAKPKRQSFGKEERSGGIDVTESVTINKPASELYDYWRDFENLPHVMSHLKSVENLEGDRSHWVAKGPVNTSIEWDAELTYDQKNERIAWRSLEGATVPNEGYVEFKDAPGGRGTELKVSLTYHPPLGPVGAAVAKLFGEEPNQQVGEDLKKFKQRMETCEVATVEGQTSGRMS
ncbi:hypothetical protein BH24DEI2_BH24DEI2_13830 [soil metagenome]